MKVEVFVCWWDHEGDVFDTLAELEEHVRDEHDGVLIPDDMGN
jgi:hypothetical protein